MQIQIWLAMAYDANNRHDDCIALYKRLEARHPNKQIKRQAADLRYILEAPKLKISREEMVSIPIIERDYDKYGPLTLQCLHLSIQLYLDSFLPMSRKLEAYDRNNNNDRTSRGS